MRAAAVVGVRAHLLRADRRRPARRRPGGRGRWWPGCGSLRRGPCRGRRRGRTLAARPRCGLEAEHGRSRARRGEADAGADPSLSPFPTCTRSGGAGPSTPIIYVIGDSTAACYDATRAPRMGWAQPLQEFFAPACALIQDRAIAGPSSKSFLDEGAWTPIRDALRTGDFVLIQFGHNDESATKRYNAGDAKAAIRDHLSAPQRATNRAPGQAHALGAPVAANRHTTSAASSAPRRASTVGKRPNRDTCVPDCRSSRRQVTQAWAAR
jgi:hypothetical protein